MRRSALRVGDRVEVNVKGRKFGATVTKLDGPGYVKIDPEPGYTWLFVAPRCIVRKLA